MSRPRFILLGGASGSGKSYLARRYGRPHLELDAYYRQIADDSPATPFPRTPYGQIDWDHPDTWNLQAAVDAVVELVETGRTSMPDYDISTSSVVGEKQLELGTASPDGGASPHTTDGHEVIIAEGVFAHAAAPALANVCEDLGVRLDAFWIDQPTVTTAVRRFARDVAERRKPIPFLIQRGWALARTERGLRERHLQVGFIPVAKPELRRLLAGL